MLELGFCRPPDCSYCFADRDGALRLRGRRLPNVAAFKIFSHVSRSGGEDLLCGCVLSIIAPTGQGIVGTEFRALGFVKSFISPW